VAMQTEATHDAYNTSACQTSTQFGNEQQSYWWFSKFYPQRIFQKPVSIYGCFLYQICTAQHMRICAETAISWGLRKVMTLPLDLMTPDFLKRSN